MNRARRDRAAAVRSALVRLVAERGFHGASMGAVAKEAGVATGTAYLYYASKEQLVYATYLEVKRGLMGAAASAVDPKTAPREQFGQMWQAAHDHLVADRRQCFPDEFLINEGAVPSAVSKKLIPSPTASRSTRIVAWRSPGLGP